MKSIRATSSAGAIELRGDSIVSTIAITTGPTTGSRDARKRQRQRPPWMNGSSASWTATPNPARCSRGVPWVPRRRSGPLNRTDRALGRPPTMPARRTDGFDWPHAVPRRVRCHERHEPEVEAIGRPLVDPGRQPEPNDARRPTQVVDVGPGIISPGDRRSMRGRVLAKSTIRTRR